MKYWVDQVPRSFFKTAFITRGPRFCWSRTLRTTRIIRTNYPTIPKPECICGHFGGTSSITKPPPTVFGWKKSQPPGASLNHLPGWNLPTTKKPNTHVDVETVDGFRKTACLKLSIFFFTSSEPQSGKKTAKHPGPGLQKKPMTSHTTEFDRWKWTNQKNQKGFDINLT